MPSSRCHAQLSRYWVVTFGLLAASGAAIDPPSDPDFELQWNLHNVGQPLDGEAGLSGADVAAIAAWELHEGAAAIVVAIVSSGVDPHPEFQERLLAGQSMVDDPYDTLDRAEAGTHMAGILAAGRNNGMGIAGLHAQVRVLPVRVVGNSPGSIHTANGIKWAVDQGADIIAVSTSFDAGSTQLAAAVDYANSNGVLIIAAAGNTGDPTLRFPAAYGGCLAVSATDHADELWETSNYGDGVDLSAPGEAVWSTLPGDGYGYVSSTAVAVAHVAGVAALVLSYAPQLGASEVRQILLDSADDLGESEPRVHFGAGRLNARRALELTPVPPLRIEPALPMPSTVIPNRGAVVALRIAKGSEELLGGSGRVLWRDGAEGLFTSSALASVGNGVFQALLPATACGGRIEYFFRAVGVMGAEVRLPANAPDEVYSIDAVVRRRMVYEDFELESGWTTLVEGAQTTGAWTRVIPVQTSAQPGWDYSRNEARHCFVTGQHVSGSPGTSDLDGGPVTLISPPITLPDEFNDIEVSYAVWVYSTSGETDSLLVEASIDGGSSWSSVDLVPPTAGWTQRGFRLSDVPGTATTTQKLQVRFVISDSPSDSLTEAAVDEFTVTGVFCSVAPADVDGDGSVTRRDARALLNCLKGPQVAVGESECLGADTNGDSRVDLRDAALLQNAFEGS